MGGEDEDRIPEDQHEDQDEVQGEREAPWEAEVDWRDEAAYWFVRGAQFGALVAAIDWALDLTPGEDR